MSIKKQNSRWKPWNERYTKEQLVEIANKYREGPGWHQGARVYGKRGS